MKPRIEIFGIHLPRQEIVLTFGPAHALDIADISNPIQKYFGLLSDNSCDPLTFPKYQSRYSVDTHSMMPI
jgi:hypothetical protein